MTAVLKAIGRLLRAPWFWLLVAALALCALAWFVGPLIAVGDHRPLAGTTLRLLVLLGVVALWGLGNLLIRVSQARTNDRLVDALAQRDIEAERQAAANRSASDEEMAAIRHRAGELLDLLRGARFGGRWRKRYVYQLPWYLVFGPPASGKTTALLNSGLRFPLAERTGRKWFTGLGGTRNCDWLLAEDAVLIDTAGRYTTQESNAAVEGTVWTGFLDLLKQYRPRQPINGAVVVIALMELARMDETEREARAGAIRERLLELRKRLNVRFPVYVVFSKLDLVMGFNEYFESLGRRDRAQVWGATFPFDNGRDDEGAVAGFGASFDGLVGRLEQRVVRRLQEEADARRRNRILDFPVQLAALKPVADSFLRTVFLPNRYDAKLLLRGYYLTSATQTGAPHDVLADAVAPAFGMTGDQLRPPPEPPVASPRACFLQSLFPGVVFAEADLVGVDFRVEAARRWSRRLAAGAVCLAAVALAGAWYLSFQHNRSALQADVTGADQVARDHEALRGAPAGPGSLRALAAILDHLRTLPAGYGAQHDGEPLPATLALFEREPVTDAAMDAYHRGLERLLLPDMLARLAATLDARDTPPALLYQTLKVYLMLGRLGPVDDGLILSWLGIDLEQRAPDDSELREDLIRHARALLDALPAHWPLDESAIASARARLSDTTLAMRGYEAAKALPIARALPEWRPIDHIGPAGTRVLLRPSGRSMVEGIPGLYTRSGFFEVFLPSAAKIADAEAREGWVLSLPDDRVSVAQQTQRIRGDMIALYLDDYRRAWDDLLADMVVVPFRSPQQAADSLNILAGPSSPLKRFLVGVSDETDLDMSPVQPKTPAAPAGAQAKVAALEGQAQAAASLADQAAAQAGESAGAAGQLALATGNLKGPPPGHPVTEHFKPLHDLVSAPGGGTAPVDDTMKAMGKMYDAFNRLARAPADPAARAAIMADLQGATDQIAAQRATLAAPLQQIAGAVADSGLSVASGGARAYMDKIWRGGDGPAAACKALVRDHFPFDPEGKDDAPPEDFAKMFAPGGTLDQFFNTHLRPYADTDSRPWRWQSAGGIQLNLPDDVLRQFERAAAIRAALFPADGKTPLARFEIAPVKVDERIDTLTLDVDGQELVYRHGPIKPVTMQWPGKEPAGARLSFSPDRDEPATTVVRTGPWDFPRLVMAGELSEDGAPDRFRLRFKIGSREAIFSIHAASVHNAFGVFGDLVNFDCPDW